MIAFLRRHRLWQAAAVLAVLFTLYWGFFAADRYVSEAHVVVENLQMPSAPSVDLSSLLSGSKDSKDSLVLRDYLLSADMLAKVQAQHDVRTHWHDSYDVFSRLLWPSVPAEWLLSHYRRRVSVEFDEHTGILDIEVEAYSREKAQAIARTLVQGGEQFMNDLAHRLAREQVAFVEREVDSVRERSSRARQAVLAHQNANGLVSPPQTVSNVAATVARLDSELATVEARRRALEAYLHDGAPELIQVRAQAKALREQLAVENSRLASPKDGRKTLNRVAEEHERLLFEAGFQQDMLASALGALERARIEASRTLKKVAVVQAPTLPDRAMEPQRLYNIALYLLGTLLLAGIVHLLIVIIREHRD